MSKVLAGELDDDDFYKTTYGGFGEDEEDNDFHSGLEESADEVDSDFDRSEGDEIKSDEEDPDKRKPRKRGIYTKAYKEPIAKKTKSSVSAKSDAGNTTQTKKQLLESFTDFPMRKSSRKSTATNSLLTVMRQKEREETDKKKKEVGKKTVTGVRRLTQEELMKLAEKTERKNLKSLEKYQRLEANRKKVFIKKKTFDGPTITHLSTVVPSFDQVEKSDKQDSFDPSKMSRNYVIFSDDSTFNKTFHYKKKRLPLKYYCPVTRKPAKYFDPVTKIPYYDLTAFKIIRKLYHDAVQVNKQS